MTTYYEAFGYAQTDYARTGWTAACFNQCMVDLGYGEKQGDIMRYGGFKKTETKFENCQQPDLNRMDAARNKCINECKSSPTLSAYLDLNDAAKKAAYELSKSAGSQIAKKYCEGEATAPPARMRTYQQDSLFDHSEPPPIVIDPYRPPFDVPRKVNQAQAIPALVESARVLISEQQTSLQNTLGVGLGFWGSVNSSENIAAELALLSLEERAALPDLSHQDLEVIAAEVKILEENLIDNAAWQPTDLNSNSALSALVLVGIGYLAAPFVLGAGSGAGGGELVTLGAQTVATTEEASGFAKAASVMLPFLPASESQAMSDFKAALEAVTLP